MSSYYKSLLNDLQKVINDKHLLGLKYHDMQIQNFWLYDYLDASFWTE